MCRADQVSIKKGLGLAGKLKQEFIPRWVKREFQKQKPSYCVSGCRMVADCTCVFTSFDTICAVASVSIDKVSLLRPLADFPSVNSIITLYNHCNPENVLKCTRCGSKRGPAPCQQ